ncbi:MAG: coabc dfp: phosphopantothenoylcysteine decarboxylase / phosphopantothenate--cysteine ligase [Verrucomicrobiaceae bacterium]|nr:coabc dfp: phosphopantothenoylcysteine decarboxylase / phosphopantothenate--cysteine ligase [Verrucomicrobiaceae bacterium]
MKLLITAGPTREALDPVRYLSNRSSGKMGYALAAAGIEAGHEVVLISGPVSIPPPPGAEVVQVESAQQMYEAVQAQINTCEAAIFAAAVTDYRPAQVAEQKIKKTGDELVLRLEKTLDILGSARLVFGFTGVLVGFAAETQSLIEHAQEKLQRKGCDLLVANDVSRPGIGFDSEENEVILLSPTAAPRPLPRGTKAGIAREIIRIVAELADPPSTL